MEKIYQAISIKSELPPVGKFVTTIDSDGEHRIYRMNEDKTWSMRDLDGRDSPNNNLPILYWLKEGIDLSACYQISATINEIRQLKEKQSKLYRLKDEIKNILSGHTEIPEGDVFDTFFKIEKLSKHLDISIEKKQDLLTN